MEDKEYTPREAAAVVLAAARRRLESGLAELQKAEDLGKSIHGLPTTTPSMREAADTKPKQGRTVFKMLAAKKAEGVQKNALCAPAAMSEGVAKSEDDKPKVKKPDTRTITCGKCGVAKPRAESGQFMCNDCWDKHQVTLAAKKSEGVQKNAGSAPLTMSEKDGAKAKCKECGKPRGAIAPKHASLGLCVPCIGKAHKEMFETYGRTNPDGSRSLGDGTPNPPKIPAKKPAMKSETFISDEHGSDPEKRYVEKGKQGVLPGDKKSKKVEAEGSGGNLEKAAEDQAKETERKWNRDNIAATEAGKKGVPLPPKGSKERQNLSLAQDREPVQKAGDPMAAAGGNPAKPPKAPALKPAGVPGAEAGKAPSIPKPPAAPGQKGMAMKNEKCGIFGRLQKKGSK